MGPSGEKGGRDEHFGDASERDLRTLAGIVSDDRADLPPHGLPLSLLADLTGQIRCDFVSFYGLDSGREATWFGQEIIPAATAR